MAHYAKFGIALAFFIAGLACYLIWPNWMGISAFIVLFVVGSMVGSRWFDRHATQNQIKEDLEARLRND